MTSTTGTDGHPEVAEISALTEGVLSPARTADLREHLADCVICDDVRVSLDEIRGPAGHPPGTRQDADGRRRKDRRGAGGRGTARRDVPSGRGKPLFHVKRRRGRTSMFHVKQRTSFHVKQ
ncbi:hypothetical protein GCM10020221_23020 [Streptomyces thioluteus]|uniref:Zinc-finger domain-containing protein n=1 Tax=Streptomyces thioluteus TaxID=66431 RepID=A0ABN3WUB9_STRTU